MSWYDEKYLAVVHVWKRTRLARAAGGTGALSKRQRGDA